MAVKSSIPTREGSSIEWDSPTPHDPRIGIYVSQIRPGEPGAGWPPKVQVIVNNRGTEDALLGLSFWLSDEGLAAFARALQEALAWRAERTAAASRHSQPESVP